MKNVEFDEAMLKTQNEDVALRIIALRMAQDHSKYNNKDHIALAKKNYEFLSGKD